MERKPNIRRIRTTALRRLRHREPSERRQAFTHSVCCRTAGPRTNHSTGSRRWKQRAIHEQREERKFKIAQLKADIACNDVLKPRLTQIATDVEAQGPAYFSSLVDKFKTSPSPSAPPTNAPEQKTYDEMLLSLMLQVWEEAKKKGVEKDDPKLGDALVAGLREHLNKMNEHQEKLKKELKNEEEEAHKKITSEDIREGFDSHVRIFHSLQLLLPLHGRTRAEYVCDA